MSESDKDKILKATETAADELIQASVAAFETFHGTLEGKDVIGWASHHQQLIAMVDHAEQTSRAIEVLRSGDLVLQSLALLRVRLEQTIVCSYLIHEDSDDSFRRYFSFGPIREFRHAMELLREAFLAEHLEAHLKVDTLKEAALRVEKSFNPNFDIEQGRFRSKWTDLDLYSMAVRRDRRCATACRTRDLLMAEIGTIPPPMLIPLASLYASIYKTASAIIHADASVLASPFTGEMKGADGRLRPAAQFWNLLIPFYLVTCDQLQCMEVLSALTIYDE